MIVNEVNILLDDSGSILEDEQSHDPMATAKFTAALYALSTVNPLTVTK